MSGKSVATFAGRFGGTGTRHHNIVLVAAHNFPAHTLLAAREFDERLVRRHGAFQTVSVFLKFWRVDLYSPAESI